MTCARRIRGRLAAGRRRRRILPGALLPAGFNGAAALAVPSRGGCLTGLGGRLGLRRAFAFRARDLCRAGGRRCALGGQEFRHFTSARGRIGRVARGVAGAAAGVRGRSFCASATGMKRSMCSDPTRLARKIISSSESEYFASPSFTRS